jgi:hypothetical protein
MLLEMHILRDRFAQPRGQEDEVGLTFPLQVVLQIVLRGEAQPRVNWHRF